MSIPINAPNPFPDHSWPTHTQPRNMITVSEAERLAKAGVVMKFEDIRDQIMSDPTYLDPPPQHDWPVSLEQSFWQRWQRAHPHDACSQGALRPFRVNASEYGDKVYVFVQPTDRPPFIIEDMKGLYPSDALMAALMLHEKTK